MFCPSPTIQAIDQWAVGSQHHISHFIIFITTESAARDDNQVLSHLSGDRRRGSRVLCFIRNMIARIHPCPKSVGATLITTRVAYHPARVARQSPRNPCPKSESNRTTEWRNTRLGRRAMRACCFGSGVARASSPSAALLRDTP